MGDSVSHRAMKEQAVLDEFDATSCEGTQKHDVVHYVIICN